MLKLFFIRSPRVYMSQRVIVIVKDPFGHLYHDKKKIFYIWKCLEGSQEQVGNPGRR